MAPRGVLETWVHEVRRDGAETVLPDGCRDLIRREGAWLVSPVMDRPSRVPCRAGEVFVGYRLDPAAVFDQSRLLAAVAGRSAEDAAAMMADLVRVDGALADALHCLSAAPSLAVALRMAGVRERTLQRLVARGTGRPPSYWRSLARVRRAAAALAGREPLAELAADHGFADQAHMTREFRRWFAVPPGALRASPELMAMVTQSGYGWAPAGVQSSTSTSSGSAT